MPNHPPNPPMTRSNHIPRTFLSSTAHTTNTFVPTIPHLLAGSSAHSTRTPSIQTRQRPGHPACNWTTPKNFVPSQPSCGNLASHHAIHTNSFTRCAYAIFKCFGTHTPEKCLLYCPTHISIFHNHSRIRRSLFLLVIELKRRKTQVDCLLNSIVITYTLLACVLPLV